MRFITDRKRAEGRGASGTGTEHHWYMQLSAMGLALLVPLFIYILGTSLGGSFEEVRAAFGRPIPAIITGLTLFVGLNHARAGAAIAIEDYTRHSARKAWLLVVNVLTYLMMATALYALVKIAL